MRAVRARLSYANVMSTLAVALAIGGGAAYAANTVFSSDIVNGEVRTADISDADGVRSADVRNDTLNDGGLAAVDLRPDSVRSSEVANNSLNGADVNERALDGLDANDNFDFVCDPEARSTSTATRRPRSRSTERWTCS
jgi:hypothetical protein